MEVKYDTDPRFERYRVATGGLFMIGMRLIIGALAGIWILFVQLLPVLLRFFKREEIGNAVLQAVIWLIVIYVLMLALHVVQIVLFFKKKKSFLLL